MKQRVVLFLLAILIIGGIVYATQNGRSEDTTSPQASSKKTPMPGQAQTPCSGIETVSQVEGPFYKSGSPEDATLVEHGEAEELLIVTGVVYNTECEPLPNVWMDFWQADQNGEYDNTGYSLRGHQKTNEEGKYTLQTVMPVAYESRPPHIHVKLRVGNGRPITSQLYFPNSPENVQDSIFDQSLLTKVTKDGNVTTATYNFVLHE